MSQKMSLFAQNQGKRRNLIRLFEIPKYIKYHKEGFIFNKITRIAKTRRLKLKPIESCGQVDQSSDFDRLLVMTGLVYTPVT